MISIVGTLAGCSPCNKAMVTAGSLLYYASDSNIVVCDMSGAIDVVFLGAGVNCVSSNSKQLVAAGDNCGGIYLICQSTIIGHANIGAPVQACAFYKGDGVIFGQLGALVYHNFSSDRKHVLGVNYIITCIQVRGQMIYVGSNSGVIYLYMLTDGGFTRLGSTVAHTNSVRDIAISEAGMIASCSMDSNIKIWKQALELMHVQTLNGHAGWVNKLHWFGQVLVSVSADKTVRLWKPTREEAEHSTPISQSYRSVSIIGGTAEFLGAIDYNGYLFGQYKTGGIDMFRENKHGVMTSCYFISGHIGEVSDLDWKYNALLSCSVDATTRLLFRRKELFRVQNHGYPLVSAKFLDGKGLRIVSGARETILRLLEATKNVSENLEDMLESMKAAGEAADADAAELYEACRWDSVTVDAAVISELSLGTTTVQDFFHEQLSENALTTNVFHETQRLYGHFFDISAVATNGRLIFSANRSRTREHAGLFVWDANGNKTEYALGHTQSILKIKVSEHYLVTASKDKTAELYQIGGNSVVFLHSFCDHRRVVWDCGISTDEKFVATCSRDGTVLLYDLPSRTLQRQKSFDCEVTALAFSPIAPLIMVGMSNGHVAVLDYGLDVIASRQVAGKQINAIAFDKSSGTAAIASADWLVRELQISY